MESQFVDTLHERVHRCSVIAVLVIDSPDAAVPVAKALLDGGIDVMELTLRTSTALQSLSMIARAVPEMLAGIGTILGASQVREVADAGAAFGVAPGLNPSVVQEAQRVGLPFAPGILTPSELERALELGCRDTKFFPAEPSGGLNYLKNMAAPYVHLGVQFVPLGGINAQNMGDYLASPLILAVGGSWLAPRDLIMGERWSAITERAQQARQLADDVRGRNAR